MSVCVCVGRLLLSLRFLLLLSLPLAFVLRLVVGGFLSYEGGDWMIRLLVLLILLCL